MGGAPTDGEFSEQKPAILPSLAPDAIPCTRPEFSGNVRLYEVLWSGLSIGLVKRCELTIFADTCFVSSLTSAGAHSEKETSMKNTLCRLLLLIALVPFGLAQDSTSRIDVSDATYALNCRNDYSGNATEVVQTTCNGKRSCSFRVQDAAQTIGDPCVGTRKTFDVTYVCGDKEKKVHVTGEAVGRTAFLTCAN
jgi:hypothetical protein